MAKAWQGRPRLGKKVLVNSLATRLLLNLKKSLPRRGAARRSGWLGRRRPAVCLFGQQKKNGLFGRLNCTVHGDGAGLGTGQAAEPTSNPVVEWRWK